MAAEFLAEYAMVENDAVSGQIIGAAMRVHSALGPGFAEKVYENALLHELGKLGMDARSQFGMEVWYDGVRVGQYIADLLIGGTHLVEIKATRALEDPHVAQGLNYLRATGAHVCLLLNFGGPRLEVRRLVPAPHWPKPGLGRIEGIQT